MQHYTLDPEEQALLEAVETGKTKTVKNFKTKKEDYVQAAKATLNKNKNVNIRLSSADLWKIRGKAVEEGIPYQTLMTSILHKYATGRINFSVGAYA